jgi:hypothetical protein
MHACMQARSTAYTGLLQTYDSRACNVFRCGLIVTCLLPGGLVRLACYCLGTTHANPQRLAPPPAAPHQCPLLHRPPGTPLPFCPLAGVRDRAHTSVNQLQGQYADASVFSPLLALLICSLYSMGFLCSTPITDVWDRVRTSVTQLQGEALRRILRIQPSARDRFVPIRTARITDFTADLPRAWPYSCPFSFSFSFST